MEGEGRGEQAVSFEWGQDKASWQWARHLVMQHNVAKARTCRVLTMRSALCRPEWHARYLPNCGESPVHCCTEHTVHVCIVLLKIEIRPESAPS